MSNPIKKIKGQKGANQKFERKESYTPDEVLNFLPNPEDHPKNFNLQKIKKDYDGDMMKMGSQRYFTFAKSLKCAHCDLVGTIFHKERSYFKNGQSQKCGFHFNLYAINENGEEIIMTKDHIVPRAKGGKDILKNYITMCRICNEDKGALDAEEALQLSKENQLKNKEEISSGLPRSGMSITANQELLKSNISYEQSVARMDRKDLPFEMPINEQSESSIAENDTGMAFETECSDIKITKTT